MSPEMDFHFKYDLMCMLCNGKNGKFLELRQLCILDKNTKSHNEVTCMYCNM